MQGVPVVAELRGRRSEAVWLINVYMHTPRAHVRGSALLACRVLPIYACRGDEGYAPIYRQDTRRERVINVLREELID